MLKKASKLEQWEIELIERRRARLKELACLDQLAAKPFKPKVIRRHANSGKQG